MEFKRPTGDFNLNALPSDEKWRKLMYMATSGSDVMLTPFETIINGETKQEIQKRKDRESYDRIKVAMASRERIEQFHVEIKEIDTQRSELLDRVRGKLRETREELKRLRDAAPEVAMPDGSRKKVYRDFKDVRTEAGELVDPALIRAETVSNDPRNFLKTRHTAEKEARLMALETRIETRRDEDKSALARADKGEMSNEDVNKHTAKSKKSLLDDTSEFERLLRDPPELKERTLQTDVLPTRAFNGIADASVAGFADMPRNNEIKPQSPPAALAPGPR